MSAVEEYRSHTENHDRHGHSDRVSRKLADAAITESEAHVDALRARLRKELQRSNDCIAEMEALAAKWKWQRDEAIADGPGYFPKDTLERRWAERTAR